jgi:DNA-binding protein H-NS
MQDYRSLPFDELRALHREVGVLIAERRHEALEQLQQQIAPLGFSVDDLVPKKKRASATPLPGYRDPNVADNVWSGRGKPPAWLKEKLEQGHALEAFEVGPE